MVTNLTRPQLLVFRQKIFLNSVQALQSSQRRLINITYNLKKSNLPLLEPWFARITFEFIFSLSRFHNTIISELFFNSVLLNLFALKGQNVLTVLVSRFLSPLFGLIFVIKTYAHFPTESLTRRFLQSNHFSFPSILLLPVKLSPVKKNRIVQKLNYKQQT